jgi:hypothetical protein
MKHCSGCCNQGRGLCPTPEACEIPREDDDLPLLLPTLGALALGLVALAAIVALLP